MAEAEAKVKIQVFVPVEVCNELDMFAERFRTSRSHVAGNFMEAGIEAFYMYEKWIMRPETGLRIAVSLDSLCDFVGLPKPFRTSEKERKFLESIKKLRRDVQSEFATES